MNTKTDNFAARISTPLAALLDHVGGHAPYLADLITKRSALVKALGTTSPEALLQDIITTSRSAWVDADMEALSVILRAAKKDIHLLCALADNGGVWPLETVTGALTAFADAALHAALCGAAKECHAHGWLPAAPDPDDESAPIPGLFAIAMGKYGAGELNYSSDIDFTLFYDPQETQDQLGADPLRVGKRLVRRMVTILEARTPQGYVFRTDLRLRPDPSSTPPLMSTGAAQVYYETLGQNWERAAYIKARICAGDQAAGQAFLASLEPYIWRRHLDYTAIEDIHAIKRQFHVSADADGFMVPGHDVKLGRGGIREIEFFVQTQQLILGGRHKNLRAQTTLGALSALSKAGHIPAAHKDELRTAYRLLRCAEHAAQMRHDKQTHTMPEEDEARAHIAALCGFAAVQAFDDTMGQTFRTVHRICSALFEAEGSLSTDKGNLVFTGVEDDPETVRALRAKGFENPAHFLERMRAWHGGRIRATRSARARALLTRLGPELVDALAQTKTPDAAFCAFRDFFERLPAGLQVLSLFANNSGLLSVVIRLLNTAPRLVSAFSQRLSVLDVMLDPGFATPIADDPQSGRALVSAAIAGAETFEQALLAARQITLEERLRIGTQTVLDGLPPLHAGQAHSALAHGNIEGLAALCIKEMESRHGTVQAHWAILGLGSLGSQDMHEGSDLDLMLLYAPFDDKAQGQMPPAHYFTRFTRRLINTLSAPMGEGGHYDIDVQLRPSGKAGPVAVNIDSFITYYQREAWSWERLALSRGRTIYASDPDFSHRVQETVKDILETPDPEKNIIADTIEMRARLLKEQPPKGPWDIKHRAGGLRDIDLTLRALMLHHASGKPGLLATNGDAVIEALAAIPVLKDDDARALKQSWHVGSAIIQHLHLAYDAPETLRTLPTTMARQLAKATGLAIAADDYSQFDALFAASAAICDKLLMLETTGYPTPSV